MCVQKAAVFGYIAACNHIFSVLKLTCHNFMATKKGLITVAKKNSALPIVLLIALVLLGGAGYYFYSQGALPNVIPNEAADITADMPGDEATIQDEEPSEDISEEAETLYDTDAERTGSTDEAVVITEDGADTIDVEVALSERGIGNPNAPIVIKEFASLTCGHCGDFHRNVYKELKETYIDTGEVYLIMVDFPLNGPAVHGSMVARCLPKSRYAGFLQLLFENQDKWAYDANYLNYLRQNAALAGLGGEAFEACINNEELRDGIMGARAEAQQQYSINSTPSFVVNEGEAFSGTRDFAYFKEIIDAELAGTQE